MSDTPGIKTHGDSNADVMLESSDGEQFYVHSYILKTFSELFRDMDRMPGLTKPIDIVNDNDKIIVSMPATSATIHDLLSFMLDHEPAPRLSPPYDDLFTLCDYLQCTRILIERIVHHVRAHVTEAPWQTFVIANKLDDPKLAIFALGQMRYARESWLPNLSVHTLPVAEAEKLSLSYLLGLLKAASRATSPNTINVDWIKASLTFSPAA